MAVGSLKVVKGIVQLKLDKREWRPYRATKIEVLEFIHDQGSVTIRDLIDQFDYTYSGANKRLCSLRRQRLIVPMLLRGRWGLSDAACDKLDYYKKL